jgi:hypothetical protein
MGLQLMRGPSFPKMGTSADELTGPECFDTLTVNPVSAVPFETVGLGAFVARRNGGAPLALGRDVWLWMARLGSSLLSCWLAGGLKRPCWFEHEFCKGRSFDQGFPYATNNCYA